MFCVQLSFYLLQIGYININSLFLFIDHLTRIIQCYVPLCKVTVNGFVVHAYVIRVSDRLTGFLLNFHSGN
jgi:hypothetical protein